MAKTIDGGIKQVVRSGMSLVARALNALSGGRVTPNGITWFGFLMHFPIAYLVAAGHFVWAGVLLIIFGLFDTLDGELARLQGRVSNFGGLLDATTDRLKETLLYAGAAYYFAMSDSENLHKFTAIAVLACGFSIAVSFVKSKGETIVASQDKKLSYPELNKLFGGGLFPFEVRMLVLVLGLFSGRLALAVLVLAVFCAFTVMQRLYRISKAV